MYIYAASEFSRAAWACQYQLVTAENPLVSYFKTLTTVEWIVRYQLKKVKSKWSGFQMKRNVTPLLFNFLVRSDCVVILNFEESIILY